MVYQFNLHGLIVCRLSYNLLSIHTDGVYLSWRTLDRRASTDTLAITVNCNFITVTAM